MKTGKYNELAKIVMAALSIFHGPVVESSFNFMGNIIDPKRSKMQMDTYNSYLNTQYYLRAHNTNAIKMFSRKDPIKEPVDKQLCFNMRNAHATNKKIEEEKQAKKKANSSD